MPSLNPLLVSTFPEANGLVRAIAFSGNKVFLGGDFTAISTPSGTSTARYGLACIDLTTNTLTAWVHQNNVSTNVRVNSLVVKGNTLYVGTSSLIVTTPGYTYAYAFDISTGNLQAWNPAPDSPVLAVADDATNSQLVLGGSFSTVGGVTAHNICYVDYTTGTSVTTFSKEPSSPVSAVVVDPANSFVYAGGTFSSVGGSSRGFAAQWSAGVLGTWDPGFNSPVNALYLSGNIVYAAGYFTAARGGAVTINAWAGVDKTTGVPTSFNTGSMGSSSGFSIAVDPISGLVVCGGAFGPISGGRTISGIGIFDSSGSFVPPETSFGGQAYALAFYQNVLYVGLNLDTYIGRINQGVSGLAKMNSATGLVTILPSVGSTESINAVAVGNGYIHISGDFTTVYDSTGAPHARDRYAILDTAGNVLPYTVTLGGGDSVFSMYYDPTGNQFYVGGTISSVNGSSRGGAAALSPTGGLFAFNPLLGWSPNPKPDVKFIKRIGSFVYIGGTFTSSGSGPYTRNSVVRVDPTTGATDTAWDPNIGPAGSAVVKGIDFDGTHVYLGGNFTSLNGGSVSITALARVDNTAGTADATWHPLSSSTMVTSVMAIGSDDIVASCNQGSLDHASNPINELFRYTGGSLNTTFYDNMGNSLHGDFFINAVNTAIYDGTNIYAACADFVGYDHRDIFRRGIAQFSVSGTPGLLPPRLPSGGALSLSMDNGDVYFAGSFAQINSSYSSFVSALSLSEPPSPGKPTPPIVDIFLRHGDVTFVHWKKPVLDVNFNPAGVTSYNIYRSTNDNLETFSLIGSVSSVDFKGEIDTMFTEVFMGFPGYQITAVGPGGESLPTLVKAVNTDITIE